MTLPALSRAAIDRAAHHRKDEAWLSAARKSGRLLVVDDERRATADENGLVFTDAAEHDRDVGLLVALIALANWHATHVRCPRCGEPTTPVQGGWVRRCDADGSEHFPRTDPAVIVLIHDGRDRCLLGRQPTWPPNRYSTLAGFVEPGEALEQAVAREIREESGVIVDEIIYRGSQPW